MFQSNKHIYYTLRFASAMCMIGHGAFGIIGKQIWLNYFAVFGIGHALGTQLMPIVGTMDILMGISLLVYPTRAILIWLVLWGAVTALCRPLSGEPIAEFIERAGNFGAPLALLILCGGVRNIRGWLSPIQPDAAVDSMAPAKIIVCLRVVVFLLLIGHGWLNLIEKKGIMGQYTALGFTNPVNAAHFIGLFEILAGCLVLIKPIRPLLFAFLVWKMGSELFYPHWELFEWVERGGSYGAILALWFALPAIKINAYRKVRAT
ncbi:MAG: DoxX family membrane protein [Mucilaginibacter sp.]